MCILLIYTEKLSKRMKQKSIGDFYIQIDYWI